MFLRRIFNDPGEPAPVAEPAPTPAPVILGIDPEPEPEPAKPVAKPTEPAPAAKPTMSQEDLEQQAEYASRYELIANDPILAQKIADHYRAKTGTPATPATPAAPSLEPNEEADDTPYQDPRIADLTQKMVNLEINNFKRDHPDIGDYKEPMATAINKFGMNLEEAYAYAKAMAPKANAPTPAVPAVPTSEEGNPAVFEEEDSSDLQAVQNRINDHKATPRFDDAIDMAIKAAARQATTHEE